jgi:hypothetical protein
LKYDEYVFVPGASHLRHPVNGYRSVIYEKLIITTP